MILSVDPGRKTGWAIFSERTGALFTLGVGDPPSSHLDQYLALIIERPHGGPGKASRADLVKLARRMQMIIDLVSAKKVVEVEPIRWKKQTDGDIMTARIRDCWMDGRDRDVLERAHIPKSYAHNAIDAYGLGRWWMAAKGIRSLAQ